MLTAAHVVCPGGEPLADVRVRAESGELASARVEWHSNNDDVDVALIEITDETWQEPRWRQPVRWGRFVTRRSDQRCEVIGFPDAVATRERRDSYQAAGRINPAGLVKAGLHAVEVDSPPTRPTDGRSWWAGMSGAAVLAEGLLVAMVTADPAAFDSRRLIALPITRMLDDPTFCETVASYTRRAPGVEPVELVRISERARPPTSPGGLLRADAARTPFRPTPELDGLVEWCRGEDWASTRLVVGPGGQGKTRLARHLVDTMARTGWATIVLSDQADADRTAVLADVSTPLLVAVDYAEGRADQLEAVIDALERADAKTRLLLLARTAGDWRRVRVGASTLVEDLDDDRIVVQLRPIESTSRGWIAAWREALTALAEGLAELDGDPEAGGVRVTGRAVEWQSLAATLEPPDRGGYSSILTVQMDALSRLLEPPSRFVSPTRHRRSCCVPTNVGTGNVLLVGSESRST